MDIEKVKKLYKAWEDKKNQKQKMWDYYCGKTDIETTYKKSKIGNNRIVKANFLKKFINEEVAFATGNPITYTRELSFEEIINNSSIPSDSIETSLVSKVMSENNANLDSELMKNLLVFGEAMELYYVKDKSFKIKQYNPLSFYVELDEENNVISALHVFKLDDKDYIEYITEKETTRLDKDYNVVATTEHGFEICPVGYCSLIDGVYNTLFTDIKELQDNIENVLSDFSNEIGDSRLSYLILKNMGLSDEEIEAMTPEGGQPPTMEQIAEKIIGMFRDNGILLLQDSKECPGEASYLLKEINPEIHSRLISILQDDIYQISQHINLNQQQSSNTSGVALMTRIIALRNKVKIQQNCMTKAIKKRIKCMFIALNDNYHLDLDPSKVGIKYTLNVPSDDSAMADIINKLVPQGILSAETGLENLSFVTNGKAEYSKAKEEMKEREDSLSDLPGDPHEEI
ncbi:phage portal protein [Clostridium perfringens]